MPSVFEHTPDDPQAVHSRPFLKLILELGPLVVFFATNAWFGIFTATAVFMVTIIIALTISWLLTRRLAIMPLVSGVVVLVFGSLTLYLHDDLFIKLKPTIVNCLFGGILLGGLVFGKSLLGYVFDSAFRLTAEGWRKLTLRWGLFFLFMAVVNEVVWRNFSTDFWISFKIWGNFPITLAFTALQFPLLSRYALPEEANDGDQVDDIDASDQMT